MQPPGPTPTTPAPGGCTVSYLPNSWNNGFTAEVRVRNDGSAVSGWTVGFAFTAGQTVTNAWNATVTQSGGQVTARNAAWNGTIPAGGTVSFGFQGTHGGQNPSPTGFTLNGSGCRAG
ncbi:cellulose-binding domain-containing protein [Micromonospora deserti]|uniref:cellulose-binding domain-containing protein n=1 Tax=Micromonospora deserti TaxID=2070366 RepID=UPI001F45438E|nr:cellulose-binding domain-containing protein [Micromonospora deserti]